jgi:TRAP-type C4-dicarboxylate transport system permease small subunit
MSKASATRILSAPIHVIDKIMAILLGILVGVLALSVMITVFLRYVFGLSYAWAEELMTMVFIGTTFFGSALGIRENEHISLSIMPGKEGSIPRKALNISVMATIIAVSAFVFRYGRQWILRVGKVPSPATGIPNGIFYWIVPITCVITIFYASVHILAQFIKIEEPRTKSSFDSGAEEGGGNGGNG